MECGTSSLLSLERWGSKDSYVVLGFWRGHQETPVASQ